MIHTDRRDTAASTSRKTGSSSGRSMVRLLGLVALVLLAGAATAAAFGGHRGGHHGGPPAWDDDFESRRPGRLHGMVDERWDDEARRATELTEAEFLAHMIPHHQEAVDRSRELLNVAERQEVVELAESIIAEQSREIEQMQAWLAERYPDTPVQEDYTPMMRSLDGLRPEVAERVFLEDMRRHHMHAVRNARMLLRFGDPEHDDIAELAETIVTSQLEEMEHMAELYDEWYRPDAGFFSGRGPAGRRHHMGPR